MIVRDAGANPVAGVQVTFAVASGGGSVTGGTATTNASGIATVGSWTLGSTPGTNNNTLTATVTGSGITGNPVTFTASATVGGPSASQSTLTANPLTITAGDAGSTITVTAKDAGGNPISGANVVLQTSGGGDFTTPAPTDVNGATTATFTSTVAGDETISAAINGVDINATATVTVEAAGASTISFTQPPTSTLSGTISPSVVVHVVDAFGNPATGNVQLTLTPVVGAGTLSGTNPRALVGGDATFDDLSVDQFGVYSLGAAAGSASSPDPQPTFVVGP